VKFEKYNEKHEASSNSSVEAQLKQSSLSNELHILSHI